MLQHFLLWRLLEELSIRMTVRRIVIATWIDITIDMISLLVD